MKDAGLSVPFIVNNAGTRLALTHTRSAEQTQYLGPVLLAHGTFSNHRSMRGLAQHLSDCGFDCWSLDFQGHGRSEKPKVDPNFDLMCVQDASAAIDHLKVLYPSQPIIWVGHSGGGLAVLTLLCRNSEYKKSIKAIVTLASQATHAGALNKHRLAIQVSSVITRLLGFAPGKYFRLGPENEFGLVMSQWYRWSLNGRWLGDDGFDYMDASANIDLPTLMLSGTNDKFIAPPEGCRALFDQLGGSYKTYQECGLQTGFSEDYNHPRLVSSRSASREIWPLISKWLLER